MSEGILSPKLSTFIKKRIPSLAKSSALLSILDANGITNW